MGTTVAEEPGRAPSREEMDRALEDLARSRDRWAELAAGEKVGILDRLLHDLHAVGAEWAEASADAKGVGRDSSAAGEEWATFSFLLRAVTMIRGTLSAVARGRRPPLPGPIRALRNGQVCARVFPQRFYDRVLYPGMTSEIWTEPGVGEDAVLSRQAALYRQPPPKGKTVLVLGAGNVSILGACDILDKVFCEAAVVVFKTHPVTDYLAPLLGRGMASLIEGGYLRIVRGGAGEGAYLAYHPLVDELHLTGSDRTYETLVFGAGEEGRRRKAAGERLLEKPFTCELGCVSPVIVVPGPWSTSDLAYQGQHLAAMQVINAGFNCLSTRVIIQHAGWNRRAALLDSLRGALSRTPTRPAYYPGAQAIHRSFMEAHPGADRIGEADGSRLPWTVIANLDASRREDRCFTTEGFCSMVAETALEARDVPAFLERAVRFANGSLWGTLTSTILVHPKSLRDVAVALAVERAVRDLRYGTVGVNLWGALNYLTMAGSWGGFPGNPCTNIQSGEGTVHNYLMVPRPQKTVIRGPFRQWPKPIIFPNHKTIRTIGPKLIDLEAAPSLFKLLSIAAAAMRG